MYFFALKGGRVMTGETRFLRFCSQQGRLAAPMRVMAGQAALHLDRFVPAGQVQQGLYVLVAPETERVSRALKDQFANDAVWFVTPGTVFIGNRFVTVLFLELLLKILMAFQAGFRFEGGFGRRTQEICGVDAC